MKRPELVHLALALLLLLALAGGYALWFRQEEAMREENVAVAGRIAQRSAEAALVEDAQDALDALAADEDAMRARLVRPDEIVAFLDAIEASGASTGASVEVVSVTEAPEDGREQLALALEISGSFDAVLRAIGVIEHGPYDGRVVSATLNGEEGGTWTSASTFRFGARSEDDL
jgi:Tfp pilus assembly protein PilO